jgi:probable HAF family extracellular repeat protein
MGAIVGESSSANSTHGFLYRDGVLTDLGTLGGAYSGAYAINSSGLIVGQSTLITGGDVPSHATLWENCQPIDLGTLGGAESFARDINDAGVVVGTSSAAGDPVNSHAVLWRDRVIEQLETGGARSSQAAAINASGTIVGFGVYHGSPSWHALMWRNGTLVDLGNFGSSAFALGLNDRGDAVGMSWDAAGTRPRPFLYTAQDELVDLEPLVDNANGWVLHQAVDICNDGRIVGNGMLAGQSRGFVLTPVH